MSKPARPLSVLVVEPHGDTAESLAALMRGRGCIVFTAAGRDEARELVGGVVPDAVLIGVGGGPGGLHAYEFARELRRLTEKKPPLLVAMLSAGGPTDRARLESAGFELWMARAGSPDELLDRLLARRLQPDAALPVSPVEPVVVPRPVGVN